MRLRARKARKMRVRGRILGSLVGKQSCDGVGWFIAMPVVDQKGKGRDAVHPVVGKPQVHLSHRVGAKWLKTGIARSRSLGRE